MIKVVFFATPRIAIKSLEFLYNSDNIEVLGVVTQPDKPVGRGHKVVFSPIKEFALLHNIPVFQPVSIKKDFEVQEELKKIKPDFFVTFAFGQILSAEVLEIPKYATINLHASLLPRYRGANPIQRAIINGDKTTGICTMVTETGLDCGCVCLKNEIEIPEDMTYIELLDQIAEKSPELIEQTLVDMKHGKLNPEAQSCENITFAAKLTKEEVKINWQKTARQIHNLVRGIYKAPSAHCFFRDKMVKIKKTHVLEEGISQTVNAGEILKISKEGIEVATVDGVLLIMRVKPEGKSEMNARDWVNGAKIKIGDTFL